MISHRVRVGLARENDRRTNVFTALDLVRDDVIPKLAERVMLKPNFFSSTSQVTSTHVDAVWGAIDFLRSVPNPPSEIIVAEGGNEAYSGEAFDNYGYRTLVSDAPFPVRLVDLNQEERWQETTIVLADGTPYSIRMPCTVLDCPCTISLAVAKTHDVCVATLAFKNMVMGALHRGDRVMMHGFRSHKTRELPREAEVLSVNLMRLARYLTPDIGVIDGTVGLEGNGPGGTEFVSWGVAAASADAFAADAVMAKAMGFEPLDLGWLAYAQQLGYGVGNLNEIEVLGLDVAAVQTRFKPHETTDQQLQWRSPEFAAHLPA
ncbi:MAG: DUF362 domain-containing protein [Spirochaetaceae bacterium]|nr:MAG: DUF362 domain-containing protein [Spirochaetaceae bacterium]